MKKIILLISALVFIFIACDEPIIAPEPVVLMPKVTLTVSPQGPVSPGDVVTVSCLAVNAGSTNNNIGAPTSTEWSFPFKVNEALTVSVTALGEKGYTASDSKKIEVLIPYVPTRTDSLLSTTGSVSAYDTVDKDGNLIRSMILNEDQKTDRLYYYSNGTGKSYNKDNVLVSSGTWKWVDANTFQDGDRFFRYVLVDNKFYVYHHNNDGSENYRYTYIGVKI